jgi:hypothetical protein
MHQILPREEGALLQNNGIPLQNLHLHLPPTPTRPPPRLRPAEPPEKGWVRPGLSRSESRGRGRRERGGGESEQKRAAHLCVSALLSNLAKQKLCRTAVKKDLVDTDRSMDGWMDGRYECMNIEQVAIS